MVILEIATDILGLVQCFQVHNDSDCKNILQCEQVLVWQTDGTGNKKLKSATGDFC